ncbi:MAG: DUF4349 domain-containing protein [Nannocystales bacterium]
MGNKSWWVGIVGVGVLALSPRPAEAGSDIGSISGVVTNADTGERMPNALVVLQCNCLKGARETTTNANGIYAFRDLPTGTFTIQVLAGQADVSKVTELPEGGTFRANFKLDPHNEFHRMIRVKPVAVRQSASVGRTTSKDPFERVTSTAPRRESPKTRLADQRKALAAAVPDSSGRTESHGSSAIPQLEAEAATSPLPEDFARQVVYSGTMSLAVFDRSTAQTRIEALVTKAGGYVQSLHEERMVVRIPARKFRDIAQEIGALGRVEAQSFEAQDVTEDYYDLRTRIEVLQRTQAQLLTLLERARTVAEALEVRRALDTVTLELESALGKQRLLSSRVDLSALSLSLQPRLPDVDTPSTNDPFPWVDDISVEGTAWR